MPSVFIPAVLRRRLFVLPTGRISICWWNAACGMTLPMGRGGRRWLGCSGRRAGGSWTFSDIIPPSCSSLPAMSLTAWVEEIREYDRQLGYEGRRLYTAQSGWHYPMPPSQIEGTDFIYFHRSGYGPYRGGTIRNPLGWKGKTYSPSLEGVQKPVICHELGQWCAYPDFAVIDKFKGYLHPGNYLVFRENARAQGICDMYRGEPA